jgi:hypothetical protein
MAPTETTGLLDMDVSHEGDGDDHHDHDLTVVDPKSGECVVVVVVVVVVDCHRSTKGFAACVSRYRCC